MVFSVVSHKNEDDGRRGGKTEPETENSSAAERGGAENRAGENPEAAAAFIDAVSAVRRRIGREETKG